MSGVSSDADNDDDDEKTYIMPRVSNKEAMLAFKHAREKKREDDFIERITNELNSNWGKITNENPSLKSIQAIGVLPKNEKDFVHVSLVFVGNFEKEMSMLTLERVFNETFPEIVIKKTIETKKEGVNIIFDVEKKQAPTPTP